MTLTERISLLNKSNPSDVSNKENIEDFGSSKRRIDLYDGSPPEQKVQTNLSIRKLKEQFELQQESQAEIKSQRISMVRQYSNENKLVKSILEQQKEKAAAAAPKPVVEVTRTKSIRKSLEPIECPVALKHQRFFVGKDQSPKEEKTEAPRIQTSRVITSNHDVKTATCDDFESIYKNLGDVRHTTDKSFDRIFSQLFKADLPRVEERFEEIFRKLSQATLGMMIPVSSVFLSLTFLLLLSPTHCICY